MAASPAKKSKNRITDQIGFRPGSRKQVQDALIKHLHRRIAEANSSGPVGKSPEPVQLEFDFGSTEVVQPAKVS